MDRNWAKPCEGTISSGPHQGGRKRRREHFVLDAFDTDTVALAFMVDPMVELLE